MRAAIIIGHNASAKGANALPPIGQSEWEFNCAVAEAMRYTKVMEIGVFRRQPGLGYSREIDLVYAQVNKFGADVSVELHFNAASPAATGTETLHSGSANSYTLASCIQRAMVSHLGLRDRGLKARGRSDRGGRSLHAGKAPAVLVEPFFGTNAEDCQKASEVDFAEMYLEGLIAYKKKKGL